MPYCTIGLICHIPWPNINKAQSSNPTAYTLLSPSLGHRNAVAFQNSAGYSAEQRIQMFVRTKNSHVQLVSRRLAWSRRWLHLKGSKQTSLHRAMLSSHEFASAYDYIYISEIPSNLSVIFRSQYLLTLTAGLDWEKKSFTKRSMRHSSVLWPPVAVAVAGSGPVWGRRCWYGGSNFSPGPPGTPWR